MYLLSEEGQIPVHSVVDNVLIRGAEQGDEDVEEDDESCHV